MTCLEFDSFKVVSGSNDRSVRVWALDTGECHTSLEGCGAPVKSLFFDEERIIAVAENGSLHEWTFESK